MFQRRDIPKERGVLFECSFSKRAEGCRRRLARGLSCGEAQRHGARLFDPRGESVETRVATFHFSCCSSSPCCVVESEGPCLVRRHQEHKRPMRQTCSLRRESFDSSSCNHFIAAASAADQLCFKVAHIDMQTLKKENAYVTSTGPRLNTVEYRSE